MSAKQDTDDYRSRSSHILGKAERLIDPVKFPISRNVIEFLYTEHLRHRQLCNAIQYLIDDMTFHQGVVTEISDFLLFSIPYHIADEEDFFSVLRQRCKAADDIEGIFENLSSHHYADRNTIERCAEVIARALTEKKPISALGVVTADLQKFVSCQRQHLALENAVILPIARVRLKPQDHEVLMDRIKIRHGEVVGATTGRIPSEFARSGVM